jgi:hypothetical protein
MKRNDCSLRERRCDRERTSLTVCPQHFVNVDDHHRFRVEYREGKILCRRTTIFEIGLVKNFVGHVQSGGPIEFAHHCAR